MITINEATNFLGLGNSTEEKAFVETAIKQSVSEIENYCYTNFQVADVIKELFIENLNISYITIGTYNIREIVSINYFNDIFATTQLISLDAVSMKKVNGIYRLYLKNNLNIGSYVISLKVGKIPTDIEPEIKSVVLEMIAIKYKENKDGNQVLGVSSSNATYPNNSDNFVIKDLDKRWHNILNKYRYNIISA